MKNRTLLLGLCVILISAQTSEAQSVDEIIANYIENTGGAKKWSEMESVVMIGSVPSPQGEFLFSIYSKKPNKMKVEVDMQGTVMIPFAYDGEVAWMLNPMTGASTAQKFPEDQASAIVDRAQFEMPYLNYQEKGHEITIEGSEEIAGVECYKLKIVKYKNNESDDITEFHFFDSSRFVPIMVRATAASGPMKDMVSETFLSGYKETDYGITMPFVYETKINGMTQSQVNFKTISINGGLEDDVFIFPGASDDDK